MERSGNFYKAIRLGYILISILIGCMAYNSLYEWQEIEALELGNKKIDELRKEINNINIQMIKFSLLGETILEWNDKDIEHYHARRMAMDSMLCRFKATYPAERIDNVRSLLEDKERQMFQIVRLMDEQQSINKKIANQIPVIVQKSVQEQSKKPKRKGFLGIFGKKKEVTPAVSTTILHSVNRNVISEQKVQDRQLSEQADSLAARNAELNRQLQELICQIEEKVQTELQSRENEIVAMREKSFMQVGGLMGFVLLLLLISYIIIHRDAKSIKQYKHKTTDLIRQLEQSVQRNEALITSRKKAVHTITHELRTPLTAITGYAGLIRKEQCEDKSGQYIQNILQSSDRMRDMLNTLLYFFRLDNVKEQPRLSPCRISAIKMCIRDRYYQKYDAQKVTQFVFSDLGTYQPGDGWNVYSEIKRKLTEDYGIPPSEVRFIQECKTDKARKAVIDAMNAGTVRVLFGSTSMLGTGVNRPAMCAISTLRYAPTLSATSLKRLKSISLAYALAPAIISFGLDSRAILSSSS